MKTNRSIVKLVTVTSLSAFIALNASESLAAGLHGGGHGKAPVIIGKAGKASNVTRTVKVMMQDNYYDMENLSIKGGETIRFVIKNTGEFVHA